MKTARSPEQRRAGRAREVRLVCELEELFTLRYKNYANSRQENGTFDVDPYARSANGMKRDFANTLSGC